MFDRAKKPAFKVWVDFGCEIGVLQTSAQITFHYKLETLIEMQILRCVNLGEKNIAGFKFQFLLLGFPDENNHIYLPILDKKVLNGSKIC